jgi:hypothetical protein
MEEVKNWKFDGSILVKCNKMETILIYGISAEGLSFLAGLKKSLSINFVVVESPTDLIGIPCFLCIIDPSGISRNALKESINCINWLKDSSCSYLFICKSKKYPEIDNISSDCVLYMPSISHEKQMVNLITMSAKRSKNFKSMFFDGPDFERELLLKLRHMNHFKVN